MTTTIHTPASLFIDQESASIPYSTATLQLNEQLNMKRNTTPISFMETGKFRKLFDRHITAFRRR